MSYQEARLLIQQAANGAPGSLRRLAGEWGVVQEQNEDLTDALLRHASENFDDCE
jgi:hypothetical protein